MFNFANNTRLVQPAFGDTKSRQPGLLSHSMQQFAGSPMTDASGHSGLLGMPGQADGLNPQFQPQQQPDRPSGAGGDFVNQFMGRSNRSWVPMSGGGMGGQSQGGQGGFDMEQAMQLVKLLGFG